MRKTALFVLLTSLALTVSAEMHTFTLWNSNKLDGEPLYILIEKGSKVLICRTATVPERGIVFAALSEDDLAYVETLNLEVRER